jgi:hypothetical protein
MNRFNYIKVFNSPFKRPKLKWYFGKIALGTPYFFPRRWVDNPDKPGYQKAVPKKIGFDFVGLGYKTKWDDHDYRFEHGPLISFVFFKWQIALLFEVPHPEHYWVCWLTYENDTDNDLLDTSTRIKIAKEINPEVWTSSKGDGKKETICYWDKVLKDKWL